MKGPHAWIPERLRSIFWKEFIQMRRDRATLRLMLITPIMQLVLFSYAIRTDVRNLPTVVFDQSRSAQSRALLDRFAATGNFKITHHASSYEDAIRRVDAGHERAAIVIPDRFAQDFKRGRVATVQVLVDATDPTASQSAIGAGQLVGQRENVAVLQNRLGGRLQMPVDVRVRPLYNPALRNALFMVPGIIGALLSNMLIITTALGITREREAGTLEQLIVTPLNRTEIMLGKIGPYMLVGFIQLTLVLIAGTLLFQMPIRGSIPLIYLVSFVFIVANLGLGLFFSTVARTQAAAIQTAFFMLLPNILLSGFMFPREAMPVFANWLGYALPLTYYLQVLRGIVLKGVGLAEIWPQLLGLVAFSVVFFTFSVRKFQKTLD